MARGVLVNLHIEMSEKKEEKDHGESRMGLNSRSGQALEFPERSVRVVGSTVTPPPTTKVQLDGPKLT